MLSTIHLAVRRIRFGPQIEFQCHHESNGGPESWIIKGRLTLLSSRTRLVRGTNRLPRFRLRQISSREILASDLIPAEGVGVKAEPSEASNTFTARTEP